MQDLGFTGRVAALSSRRPWLTVAVWVVVIATAIGAAGRLGGIVTDEGGLAVATESERADALVEQRLTGEEPAQEFVLVQSGDLTVSDPEFAAELERITMDLRDAGTVASAVSALDGVPGLVSADGHTALVVVTLAGDPADAMDTAVPVTDIADDADRFTRFTVTTVGNGSVGAEFTELAEETLQRGEMFGIPIALVILVLVFGAAVAAGIPLLLAGVSIVLALGLTVVAGQAMDLSYFVTNMITMIGLAVGIDYTLFIVHRFREERAHGFGVPEAVIRAGDSASRAVFFSGTTVVIALTGLLAMPDTVMRSLGTGAILAVLASVVAALTLLPAILSLLGDRVNKGRLPFAGPVKVDDGGGRFWGRVTRVVTARPIVSVVAAAGILVVAALPYLSIDTGQNFIDSLPEDSESRYAFALLNQEFDTGVVSSPIVVDAPDVTDPAVQSAAAALGEALDADPAYGGVITTVAPSGDLLVLDAVLKLDPSSEEAHRALTTLRTETIPTAFAGADADVLVTGDTAWMADYSRVISERTPWIIAVVLTVSFLLLMVVFRSIVVPLKAIVMNLLSVGAAYGLLVLVFQRGVGAGLFGFRRTDVIEAWVPMFLFAVLFGLSMDYHIFLLSRIKERYDAGAGNLQSVAFGLGSTGAIITGAALIMVAVFGGFAAGDLVMFQQMGFGLAVAVILDATIVRSVLVPATMALLGDLNWYFPRWLSWLPAIDVEGASALRGRAPLPEKTPA